MQVGLTGGYATGKSFVAAEFERLGCLVIYADKLGHQVLLPGGAAFEPTVQAFGPAILNGAGQIDRQKLGAIVFASPDHLAQLNAIVHPAVFALEQQLLDRFATEQPHGVAILEAAILIETGRYKRFDRLIVTTCSEDLQIARAMARDNATVEQVRARLQMQMPSAEKVAFADYTIDTGGTNEATRARVAEVYESLRSLA